MTQDIIMRTFSADLTAGDGRTVDCRIIPYGEQAEHNDGLGGVARGLPYREEWAPGVFQHQERAANRVLANIEHEQGAAGIVGHGLVLREAPDGFYGSFRIHDGPTGDTALTLINEGVLNTVSLEARPQKSVRTTAGVIRRMKADLLAVAFARFGAYKGAAILAVREEASVSTIDDEELPTELVPFAMNPDTVERCRALGIAIPARYEAHPDPATPSTEDTADTAPAEATATTTSEATDGRVTERT